MTGQDICGGVVVERVRTGGLDAGVVAVAVVVGGHLAELRQPGKDVGRVGAQEGEIVLGDVHRPDRGGERVAGALLDRRQLLQRVGEVVVLARQAGDVGELREDRDAVVGDRGGLAEERRRVAGRRIGRLDERVEVVERRPQVHVGGVRLPQRLRERRQGAVEVVVAGADRRQRLVGGRDQRGQVLAPIGEGSERLRAGDEEAGEGDRVARELLEELRGRAQRRVQELVGTVREDALAGIDPGVAADELLQGRTDAGPEDVEELIDVDRGGRVLAADRRVVLELRRVVRTRRQRDVAVGDAGERGLADQRGRSLAQRLVHRHLHRRLVVVGQVDRVDRAHPLARGQHLVAGDELAAGLEQECVAVAAVAAEQQHDDDRDRDQNRGHGSDPGRRRGAPVAAYVREGRRRRRRGAPVLPTFAAQRLGLTRSPDNPRSGQAYRDGWRLATGNRHRQAIRQRSTGDEQLARRRPPGREHLGLVATGVRERLNGQSVGDREQVRDRRLGPESERDRPLRLLLLERPGDVISRPPEQRPDLAADLLVAAAGGEQVEEDDEEPRIVLDQVHQARDEDVEDAVDVGGAAQRLVEHLDAVLAVAPDDLDEQPLLGAEVVVEKPAADAGLGGDVLEGRPGDAPLGDRIAHRVDDAAGAVAAQLTRHSGSPRPGPSGPARERSGRRRGRGGRRGVLELLLGAEELVEDGLADVLAQRDREDGADERDEQQLQERMAALRALVGLPQRLGCGAKRLAGALEVTLKALVVEQRRRLLGSGGALVGVTAGFVGLAQVVAELLVLDQALDVGARVLIGAARLVLRSGLGRHSIAPLGSPVLFPASISPKR